MESKKAASILKIGISTCIMHADPLRPIFKGKALFYVSQPISDWLMTQGVFAYLIPLPSPAGGIELKDFAAHLDGLLLQGGADVAPESYGEKPLKPEWAGDLERDQYEIALIKAFQAEHKPILGICRGMQLLNVALGGTLYQDISTQVSGSLVHRNWDIYDQNFHEMDIVRGSYLASLYGGRSRVTINSVHHQGVKDLAPGLVAEGRSHPDGIVEAVRLEGSEYIVGVQWHPEFQTPADTGLLPAEPLLISFLQEAKKEREKGRTERVVYA